MQCANSVDGHLTRSVQTIRKGIFCISLCANDTANKQASQRHMTSTSVECKSSNSDDCFVDSLFDEVHDGKVPEGEARHIDNTQIQLQLEVVDDGPSNVPDPENSDLLSLPSHADDELQLAPEMIETNVSQECGITVDSDVGSSTTTAIVIHGATQMLYEVIKQNDKTCVCSVCEVPYDIHHGAESKAYGVCEINMQAYKAALATGKKEIMEAVSNHKHKVHTACGACVEKHAHIFEHKCAVCYKRFDAFVRSNCANDVEAKVKWDEYNWMMGQPMYSPTAIELVDLFVNNHIQAKKTVEAAMEESRKRKLDESVEEKVISKKFIKQARAIEELRKKLEIKERELELQRERVHAEAEALKKDADDRIAAEELQLKERIQAKQKQAEEDALRVVQEAKHAAEEEALRVVREAQHAAEEEALRVVREAQHAAEEDALRVVREAQESAEANALRVLREAQESAEANAIRLVEQAQQVADVNAVRVVQEAQQAAEANAIRVVEEAQQEVARESAIREELLEAGRKRHKTSSRKP